MTWFRRLLVAMVAAGLLAACGGESNTGDPAGSTEGGEGPAPAGGDAPSTQLAVPDGYDTSRGWESELLGTHLPLPHSDAVAVFGFGGGQARFTVLDVTNGEVLWRSSDIQGPDSPDPLAVTVSGRDYLVATASGVVDEGVVSKGREITTIDIFEARGSAAAGDDVEPVHHLELEEDRVVTDGGAGLLVEYDDGVKDDLVLTVDPATGATEEYDLGELDPPDGACVVCTTTEAVAVTAEGPLLTTARSDRRAHYWVPGAWYSGDLTPSGNADVFVTPVAEDLLIAKWHDGAKAQESWAVLDSATGEILAQVGCEPSGGMGGSDAGGSSLSAQRRYLVFDYLVFDLQRGTGHCFEETDRDKPVHLTEVTDDGVAFGVASGASVVVDVATGQVSESDHTAVPFSDYAGFGLFWDEEGEDGEDGVVMVAYPHSE